MVAGKVNPESCSYISSWMPGLRLDCLYEWIFSETFSAAFPGISHKPVKTFLYIILGVCFPETIMWQPAESGLDR